VLDVLQQVLDTLETFKGRQRVIKNQGDQMAVQCLLNPERWILMDLASYQARSVVDAKTGHNTLPLLHRDTLRELAEPLSRLSLVNHTCRICGDELETPYYRGMLENVLAGNADLPHRPNDRRAIKYPLQHKGCLAILKILAQIEVALQSWEEGVSKDVQRYNTLMGVLAANDRKLAKEFLASEYRPLDPDKGMQRIDAIVDHVKAGREEYVA
jgi:hypothetical protein